MNKLRASWWSWTPLFFSCGKEAKLWVKAEGADWPTDWLSNRRYEFPQPLWEKIIVVKQYYPPLRSTCSVVLLWKRAKMVHIRNLTPSYGQNSDVQSHWCTPSTALYLHSRSEWASPSAMMSVKRENENIADWRDNCPIRILSVCIASDI